MKIDALPLLFKDHSTWVLDPTMPPLNLLQLPRQDSAATNHAASSTTP